MMTTFDKELLKLAAKAGSQMTTVQVNPLHATRLPDDVQCYQTALDAAFAAGAAGEREEIAQYIESTELGNLPDALKERYARMLNFYATQIRARGEA